MEIKSELEAIIKQLVAEKNALVATNGDQNTISQLKENIQKKQKELDDLHELHSKQRESLLNERQKKLNEEAISASGLDTSHREILNKIRRIIESEGSFSMKETYHEEVLRMNSNEIHVNCCTYGSYHYDITYASLESIELFAQTFTVTEWYSPGRNSGHGFVPGDAFPGRNSIFHRVMNLFDKYLKEIGA